MKFKSYMVAAALAATASTNAFAVMDLDDDANDQTVSYASEVAGAVDGNGRYSIVNFGTLLDVTVLTGFTIAQNTSKYARFDLTGAVFDDAGAIALTNGTIAQGGASQDDFVIFEVNDATGDITAVTALTLAVSDYDVEAAASINYVLYEMAADAVNETNPLSAADSPIAAVVSGSTGDFTESNDAVATVAAGFTAWDFGFAGTSAISATLNILGQTDPADILNGATYTLAGALTVVGDYITAGQDITLTGDVAVGAFDLDSTATCAGTGAEHVALVADATDTSATATVVGADVALWVCVELAAIAAGELIAKGAYTLTLDTDTLTNTIGSVVYDTTTVEIPYITTFEGYNQRIFIDNRGGTDAFYTTSFTTESTVTAAGGTGSTGTVPANTIMTIKAVDLVTFTGGTRGAATVEIEAQGTDIWATTQIVDLDLGNTDTLLLQP